ncbi:MAG: class F sortase [bacterium]|nr:class F sortase [bacterium]
MYNSALRQKIYYVDSLSINTKRGLRQKGRSCKCSSLAPVGYIDSSLIETIIGGITSSLIIIYFLFIIFNSPTQDSYIKPALAASSQPPQNLVDDQSAEFVQSVVVPEQAHLSANSQTSQNLVDDKPVELAQNVILFKSESLPVDQPNSGTPASPASPELGQSGSAGRPVSLKIPKINVDAAVEYVGLTSQGEMDVPKGPSDVAWFKFGARPGDNGSAVIAGHHGRWKNGQGSVFDDLNKLSEGDKLYIEDEKGEIATFVVRESRRYDPKADARDVFNSNDGGSHLNLIVCDGVWDKATKSYSQRLVVFADKVDSTSSPQE